MLTRPDKQGAALSILGFGCMRLPGGMRIDRARAEALLLRAVQGGVNYFDTAYLYPGSEAAVGEIFEKHKLREKVHIATKLPHTSCRAAADFDRIFAVQTERLLTGYIDYYLIHNITGFSQWERLHRLGFADWAANKKVSGQIRNIGFSFHGPCHDFIKLLDAWDWDMAQVQYNYLNTRYQAGEEGIAYARQKGVPVVVMEPLLGGALARPPAPALALLQKALPGTTPAALALRFVWDNPGVTLLLSGMNALGQLEENLALAANAPPGCLSEAERRAVDDVKAVVGKSYKIPCTGCNYCMPCPQKLNIPGFFSAYNASYAVSRLAGTQQYLISSGGMSDEPHFAGDCAGCGACEQKCPQRIEIRRQLARVGRRLHPPGLKTVLRIARAVMGR